ncbi:MAG: hypothetical protein K2Q18_08930, partial [Bdellovibrionales bacterium]|nr:hypothetical protein [Bdellovibrionales bacterium]
MFKNPLIATFLTIFLGIQGMQGTAQAANSGAAYQVRAKSLSLTPVQSLEKAKNQLTLLKSKLIIERENLLKNGYINKMEVANLVITAVGVSATLSVLNATQTFTKVGTREILALGSVGGAGAHGITESAKTLLDLSTRAETKERSLKMIELVNEALISGEITPEQKTKLLSLKKKFEEHSNN